ncbi:MAG TPA: protein kinase, partial [Ktedonobacterales bacterium]|nr:protein kinase [Ktedonobacterales bacterium]
MSLSSEISHVGLRLLNRYSIDEPLPAGALCRVYRGQDTVLRRSIAVKAVPPEQVATYRNALHATASLSHPAIVTTYDALEHDDWLFVIQEYVTARPLTTYLRDGVPSERAAELGGQIARALTYAHAHDITHGDLTPAAVLVDRQAVAQINNFRLPTDSGYFAERAREWDVAPELLLAPPNRDHPSMADITATGLLLWLLLSELKRPAADSPDVAQTAARRDFRPDVPEALREVVRRCVRQAEVDAITDAGTLSQELEEIM